MRRYFDLHDKRLTAQLEIEKGSPASTAAIDKFKKYFKSEDVRELTLSQYRRLSIQYRG